MCKPLNDGYEMDDGVLVRYDAPLNAIKPEYIKKLNEENSNAWDSFLLHRESKEFTRILKFFDFKLKDILISVEYNSFYLLNYY